MLVLLRDKAMSLGIATPCQHLLMSWRDMELIACSVCQLQHRERGQSTVLHLLAAVSSSSLTATCGSHSLGAATSGSSELTGLGHLDGARCRLDV